MGLRWVHQHNGVHACLLPRRTRKAFSLRFCHTLLKRQLVEIGVGGVFWGQLGQFKIGPVQHIGELDT
jgi:hypothetical protein